MLSDAEERPLPPHVLFWRGVSGKREFERMVAAPVPESVLCRCLHTSLIGAEYSSEEEVREELERAAARLRDAHASKDTLSRNFERHVCAPQPARHSTYAGETDRERGEMSAAHPSNKFHSEWLRLSEQRRAVGLSTRKYYGVAQQ